MSKRRVGSTGGGDGAERLLALATSLLPARRAEWGAALRAELHAIDDPRARWRFARSASLAAFGQGPGARLAATLGVGIVVAAITLAASRLQLEYGGPGVLTVTVPVPALLLLSVALWSAFLARSFGAGLIAGGLALAASFAAVAAVVAVEGLAWMDRHGVFVLDGDPPRHAVGALDVALDFFATGMWIGHLAFWLPWVFIGAALGVWPGTRQPALQAGGSPSEAGNGR